MKVEHKNEAKMSTRSIVTTKIIGEDIIIKVRLVKRL